MAKTEIAKVLLLLKRPNLPSLNEQERFGFTMLQRSLKLPTAPSKCILVLLVMLALGCGSEDSKTASPETVAEPIPVSIVIVDAEDVSSEIVRQWAARRNGQATITNVTLNQLLADQYAITQGKDVLIYPSHLMGQLILDGKIKPLGDEVWNSEELSNKSLLRHARGRQIRFDDKKWAVPLGSPNFFALYRQDVLEAVGKTPPRTWNDFFALIDLIENSPQLTNQGLPRKVFVPLEDGIIAHTFFALAAAQVRQQGKIDFVFQRQTMQPLIATPPYVEALQAMKRHFYRSGQQLSVGAVMQKFFSSNAAVVIGWPAKAFFADLETIDENVIDNTVLHPLPAGQQWFDFKSERWVEREQPLAVSNTGFAAYQASVLDSANYPTEVNNFLAWLGSKKTCSTLFSNSAIGGPSRVSHLGNPQNWTADVLPIEAFEIYADETASINNRSVYLTFPRIPGADRYLKILAQQLKAYLQGDSEDPQACLQKVANEWEEITDQLGRKEQTLRLRKDFGL